MQLAVFDLDGTITRHDSLVPYVLGFIARRPVRLIGAVRALPAILLFALGRIDRGRLKAAVIKATLGGATRAEIATWTTRFVPTLLPQGLHASALEAIAGHRAAGDVLVVLSASPDLYVPQIATALGFRETICTGVQWQGERLDGALSTPNRRGEEKTRCLAELMARFAGLPTVAYGNAASDLDHLARVDRGILVNGSPAARRRALELGIDCVDWT